jgi:AmmeMemoRadiSam system protein B/AmmeMemoRadiSam system protein A
MNSLQSSRKQWPVIGLFLTVLMAWHCGAFDQAVAAADKTPSADLVRESVLAGSWYPAAPEELRRQIEGFISRVPLSETTAEGRLLALISPHAGYMYSGQVAAYGYKLLERRKFQTVIVLAPSHHARFPGVSVYDRGGFRTPLGVVPLDTELITALEKRDKRIRFLPEAHTKEHALEIHLPFLQVVMPGFKLVPLVMGEQDLETCRWLAEAIADCVKNKPVLLVASSDLSHFHSSDEARRLDQVVLDKVSALDPQGLLQSLAGGKCEACGGGPMAAAMLAAGRLGAIRGRVLNYADSGDVTGDRTRVVGYLAAAFWAEAGAAGEGKSEGPKVGVDLGLSAEDKAALHRIARESIEARLLGKKAPSLENLSAGLREDRGAFVTLKIHGQLRGCIGRLVSDRPLGEVVAEMALAAAFQDSRFSPLRAEELKGLEIEISALTPFQKITGVEEIQVGKHGILMRNGRSSGLLLPQVATDYGWDRTGFLEHTCQKAGLPKSCWKDKDTEITIFSADVF